MKLSRYVATVLHEVRTGAELAGEIVGRQRIDVEFDVRLEPNLDSQNSQNSQDSAEVAVRFGAATADAAKASDGRDRGERVHFTIGLVVGSGASMGGFQVT